MEPQPLQPDGSRRRICKVCVRQYANYTCPRCNLPYCSLDCYKQHGERCTESFYRDQAVAQLRGTRASAEERRHMLEVLARMHAADDSISPMNIQPGSSYEAAEEDEEEEGSEDSSEADAGNSDAVFGTIRSILSEATKARLKQKAQVALAEGRDFEIDVLEDLTAAERAALEQLELQDGEEQAAAAASPALGTATTSAAPAPGPAGAAAPRPGLAEPVQFPPPAGTVPAVPAAGSRAPAAIAEATTSWVPWWLSDAARDLQLNATGQPLVSELPSTQPAQPSSSTPATSTSSAAAAALPQPPAEPLPSLSALTKAQPSPLLRWQLLQLLFGYCMVSRLTHEQPGMDALQAAELLLALVPALDSATAAQAGPVSSSCIHVNVSSTGGSSTTSSSSRPAEDGTQPTALDARTALSACLARACTPPTGSSAWRQVAVQGVGDAAAVVGLRRSALVLALTDAGRTLEAGIGALKHVAGARATGKPPPAGMAAPAGVVAMAGVAATVGKAAAAGRPGGGKPAGGDAQVLKQQLKAAAAKMRFFTVWANEQEPQVLQQLAAAAVFEFQQQAAALGGGGSQNSGVGAIGGAGLLASPVAQGLTNAVPVGSARPAQSGVRKLVQELPGSAASQQSMLDGQQAGTADMPANTAAAMQAAVAPANAATAAASPAGAPAAAPPALSAAVRAVLLTQERQRAQAVSQQQHTQQQPLDVSELD